MKKSQATAAWQCKNCDQVTSDRCGAGSTPLDLRICHTVEDAIRWPRPASSPWMRRYPQVGFSDARRRTSFRSSIEVGGRPGPRVGWVGPVAGDSATVPSEQGVGGDEPAGSARSGERGCDGAQQRPVIVAECGSVDLAAQDGELMA